MTSEVACAVICDASLLRVVTGFQRGLPRDLHELLATVEPTHGALPRLAIDRRDQTLLRRLHRLHCTQQSDFQRRRLRAMAFDTVWLDALRAGDVATAAWIMRQPTIPWEHHSAEAALGAACESGQVGVMMWLLARRPERRMQFTTACVARVASVALFQWLERHVHALPCSTDAMDTAATRGRLELVRYLHSNRSEGCTTAAMDGAATNGHVEIVQFLHTHRPEGATSQAIAGAAEHGHLDVVKYLTSNRITESSVLPISKAALYGHVEVVQYLHTRLPATLVGLRRKSCRARSGSVSNQSELGRGDVQ